MFPAFRPRPIDLAFYSSLLLIALFFFWSRINSSDYLYFVGDGTVIVALIEEMLKSGDWTADVGRIAHTLQVQSEWQPYAEDTPQPGGHYFNLSGYVVVATAFCKGLQILGFDSLSIPFMLRGFNVILQGLILLLLFLIGRQIAGRNLGLLNMLFFSALPLAVTEAHYERPESWLAFLSTLMLFALIKYSQTPIRSALIIGSAFGLSVAVKISQLFLGVMPLVLLGHLFLKSRSRTLPIHGAIMAGGIIIAIAINVPFIFYHLPDYFDEIYRTSGFFDKPHPMYSVESYSYANQFFYIGRYFLSTLGVFWCVLLIIGIYACLFSRYFRVNIPLYYKISLVIPPLFIILYFSLKSNFMERIFSSTEPMLCILSAIGLHYIYKLVEKLFNKKTILNISMFLLVSLILYFPIELNYKFVQHHIRQPAHQPRIEFQDELKKYFHGFWIKNVHVTVGFAGVIPEKPAKYHRIYHLEDYNQYWTAPHLATLKKHGFVHIATYCSDFYDLPASNFTIYHAAAKNHYFVRKDEWPSVVMLDYFKTNCP